MVVREAVERDEHLLQVVFAHRAFCGLLSKVQRGQQQRGKNCDDGDDDEQFHQREPACFATGLIHAQMNLAEEMPAREQRNFERISEKCAKFTLNAREFRALMLGCRHHDNDEHDDDENADARSNPKIFSTAIFFLFEDGAGRVKSRFAPALFQLI